MDETYVELQEKLGQPEVASDPEEFREISKSIAQMKEAAEGYRKFMATEEALEEARCVSWRDSLSAPPVLPLSLIPPPQPPPPPRPPTSASHSSSLRSGHPSIILSVSFSFKMEYI